MTHVFLTATGESYITVELFLAAVSYLVTLACCPVQHYGLDVHTGGVVDTHAAYVWEPALVKHNALQAATEAACLVVSVDETVRNPRSEAADGQNAATAMAGRGGGRAMRGRGRGMRR